MITNLSKGSPNSMIEHYRLFEENKEEINEVLQMMRLIYRDYMNLSLRVPENRLINMDKKDILLNNARRFTAAQTLRNIEIIDAAERELKANANFEAVIKVMLMKLSEEKH